MTSFGYPRPGILIPSSYLFCVTHEKLRSVKKVCSVMIDYWEYITSLLCATRILNKLTSCSIYLQYNTRCRSIINWISKVTMFARHCVYKRCDSNRFKPRTGKANLHIIIPNESSAVDLLWKGKWKRKSNEVGYPGDVGDDLLPLLQFLRSL